MEKYGEPRCSLRVPDQRPRGPVPCERGRKGEDSVDPGRSRGREEVTRSPAPYRLTLCFELNLPGKYVLAIENAATTNPNAKMPIPVECIGNHHLLLDRPLAIRGTSIPTGKKNIV